MKKKAFTLSELLVVVVIIGVLSAVVLPKFSKVIETRKTTEAEELMSAVRTEQEARCTLSKSYTASKDSLGSYKDGKNYDYSLGTVGMTASAKSGKYKLEIPSYADGRICCSDIEIGACNNLSKNYPLCSDLTNKSKTPDYVVGNEDCGVEVCTGEDCYESPTPDQEKPEIETCDSSYREGEEKKTYGDGRTTCGTKVEKYRCQGTTWTLELGQDFIPKPDDEEEACGENYTGTKTRSYECSDGEWKPGKWMEDACEEACTSDQSMSCEVVATQILSYDSMDTLCRTQGFDKANEDAPTISACNIQKWIDDGSNLSDESNSKLYLAKQMAPACCRNNKFKLTMYGQGTLFVDNSTGIRSPSGVVIGVNRSDMTKQVGNKNASCGVADESKLPKLLPCRFDQCADCDENAQECNRMCYLSTDSSTILNEYRRQYNIANATETFHAMSKDGVVGVSYADGIEKPLWAVGSDSSDQPSCDYSIDPDKTASQILENTQAGFYVHGDAQSRMFNGCASYCRKASADCRPTKTMTSSGYAHLPINVYSVSGTGKYCMQPYTASIDVYNCVTSDFKPGTAMLGMDIGLFCDIDGACF